MENQSINKPKPRRTIYTDAIKTIYQKFIKPFIQSYTVTDEQSLEYALGAFFNASVRTCYVARATKDFKLPGKCWGEVPDQLVYGIGDRLVIKGDYLWVRTDESYPERYAEIEFKDNVYVMFRPQFNMLQPHLEIVC